MNNQPNQPIQGLNCPWTIVRILPNAQLYTVARFYNRCDAEDHKRALHRFIPAAEFEIVFDSPVNEPQTTNN